MHDARIVFAKQDTRSMWLKLFIIKLNESKFTNVSCYNVTRQRKDSEMLLFQLFLKTHIRSFMLTIVSTASQHLMKFLDKIFTRFTVLRTSQLYKNNIKCHDYNLYVCGKPYLGCIYFFVDL